MKLNELFVQVEEDMQWGHPALAIYTPTDDSYILYKTDEKMKKELEEFNIQEDSILGMIEMGWDEKNNVADIARVFAQKGYGPLLYYIANTEEKFISPHPRDVSEPAKNIWKSFFNSNSKRVPIKNWHKEEYMQFKYRANANFLVKARSVLSNGKQAHQMFMKQFPHPNEQENTIWEEATSLAGEKMKEVYGE